jgi:predicted dehydrogenase
MFTILGSGFGIYGYLPALIDGCAQRIVLPERYRARFCDRPELVRFIHHVDWAENENTALNSADGVVLALRPIDQSEWVSRCLARANMNRLLLEKPLAHTPEVAAVILDDLLRSKKMFRIGYTFRFSTWGELLLNSLNTSMDNSSISIHWSFLAHHFRHDLQNWKRSNAAGGGALRFYGIHLVALFAEIGYREVNVSRTFGPFEDEIEKWVAVFTGSGLPECTAMVDTKAINSRFHVEQITDTIDGKITTIFADLDDPFDSGHGVLQKNNIDQRVPILDKLCRSLWQEEENEYEWYDATIALWKIVEKNTKFERLSRNSSTQNGELR